ncbi:MAG: hypothetical protein PHF56_15710 [Desulfuromonadaceae bacterium]|nr:hypothetical protein [Desulfuromonadaceae bacterium]
MLNAEIQNSQPFQETASQWYLDLLCAEMIDRGQLEATRYLHELLRVQPVPGQTVKPFNSFKMNVQQRITEYEVRLNGQTGESISWFADFLSVGGNEALQPEVALKLATDFANPPDDAELESSEYETMADRTFFRARWRHCYDGLEVDGDYIEVLLNCAARMPFSVSRVWRQPNLSQTPILR